MPNDLRPTYSSIASLAVSATPPIEQRRRTIGAIENVILPVHGLKPRPNPTFVDLPKLRLPATINPKKLFALLNGKPNKVHASQVLSTSVPAQDVPINVVLNRHVNEGLRLEDIAADLLETVNQDIAVDLLNQTDDDSDGGSSSDRDGSDAPEGGGEVVTRDETNFARHFGTRYRFDAPELEGSNAPADVSSDVDDLPGSIVPDITVHAVGSWASEVDYSFGESIFNAEKVFIASPVLCCALQQTRLATALPTNSSDGPLDLPEALSEYELRQSELLSGPLPPPGSTVIEGIDNMLRGDKIGDAGVHELCFSVGDVSLDDI